MGPSGATADSRQIAALLRSRREALLERWARRVLGDPAVPEANRLSEPALRDHVPGLIDQLADLLDRSADAPGDPEAFGRAFGMMRAPRDHASHRFGEGYDLVAALRELSHLRVAIIELCRDGGVLLGDDTAQVLHAAMDEGLSAMAVMLATMQRQAMALAVEVLEHGDACLVVDADWTIVFVNRNQERLSKTTRGESVGRNLWEVFPSIATPTSKFWIEYHRAMETRATTEFEAYDAPLGIWAGVVAYPMRQGGVAVFSRDISAQKHVEEELLREATFRDRFIGILGHDLRTPLASVVFTAATLLRQALAPGETRAVQRIATAADRMVRMISDLLDFARSRGPEGIPVVPRAVDLGAVARQVVDEIAVSHPARRVALEVRGDPRGTWDGDRLAQVVSNLVTNALDYSPAESPVGVVLDATAAATVTLDVHNAGGPIAPDAIATLFDPFRRSADADERATRGLGLGLYIVREIVRAHGGAIHMTSDARDGTTFRVELPRHTAARRGAGP
jgi:sigma-B regulation protein RsbU (phosphoserine phosphatase)